MLKRMAFCLVAALTAPTLAQIVPHKSTISAPGRSDAASVAALEERVAALEKRLKQAENMQTLFGYELEQKQDKDNLVVIDPSSRSFQRVDTDYGSFLISLEQASPYLNGYEIKLSIGNPSDATFPNVGLKIRWGKAFKAGEDYSSWAASLHEKDETLTSNLQPGTWNPVTVDLLPCGPDDLGYLGITLTTTSAILRNAPE